MEFKLSYLKSWKMMLWKCFTQHARKFRKLPKKGNAKECSNYHPIALISQASKVMLKILQVRLQQYMNWELPDAQAGFRKGRGTRDQIVNSHWIIEEAREFQKNIYFCFIDYAKVLDCVDHNKLGKILKQIRIPDHVVFCMQVRKKQLEPDMEQWTGSNLEKENLKAVYCHPAYLTSMQSTSLEMPGWMKVKLESRFPGEVSITSDILMTQP